MANKNRVFSPHYDQVVDSEKRDVQPAFIENNIIGRVERSNCAIRRIFHRVAIEIVRDCSPTSDIVPIETRFHHQHATCLFHDGVIKRNLRQLAKAFVQYLLEFSPRPNLRNKVRQFRGVPIKFAQHGGHRPYKHSRIPAKVSLAQERLRELRIGFLAKSQNAMNFPTLTTFPQPDYFALLDVAEAGKAEVGLMPIVTNAPFSSAANAASDTVS